MLDLAGHDRLGHAGGLQKLDTLTEMAERDPVEVRAGVPGRPLQLGKGFLFDGDHGHVVADVPCSLERQKGEGAVAGDDAYAGHR